MSGPAEAPAATPDPVRAPAGIMYSCFGEKYLAEAVRAARSSLRHNDVPHVLFADAEVPGAPPGLEIVRFEPTSRAPFVDRIANMRRSPFERTIYLDTDTYVVDEIVHVLELLDNYDLALANSPVYRGLEDPEVPRAFPEFNCGVVAWRSTDRVAAFLRSWEETYRQWLVDDVLPGRHGEKRPTRSAIGDQPAFRRCAWQHGMAVATLPPEYNLRLGLQTTVVDRVRVLHGHTDSFERFAERYNSQTGPRTYPQPPLYRRVGRPLKRRLRRTLRKLGR